MSSALNPDIVQSLRATKRQCHATLHKSSWYAEDPSLIRAFLATRRGLREIEHHLERFPIRSRVSYILPATAATCCHGRVCFRRTRDRRGDFPPLPQLPPEESCTGENNACRSSVQNNSLPPPRPRRHSKPIEVRKTFAAGAQMIDPRINFGNRDLMAR